MIHEILPVGWLQCNCSIVADEKTRDAAVIDPGDEVEKILAIIARYDLKVRYLINTHAHIDHVGGLQKLRNHTGAPVLMHADDLDLYRNLEMQAQMIGLPRPRRGLPAPPQTEVDGFLKEGDRLNWGDLEARVLHTPGHTRGSISLLVPAERSAEQGQAKGSADRLFAGDTLFQGSIGRTDLWGGSFEAIMRSIREKLLVLADNTIVYPGHGPETTIGREREWNPFLQDI
jgi:glyoxylase-like metal-dependent hydrolase (beta-lactamase superfamily II)